MAGRGEDMGTTGTQTEESGTRMVTVSTQTEGRVRLKAGRERLLPGLPNDITLDHIVPKLPWRAFKVLSLVSLRWQQAIFNHHVRDARVRSHSTKTHVLFQFRLAESCDGIAVYSVEDRVWSQLPSIPHLRRGLPRYSQCVSLDGSIYVFNGLESRVELYVLDLAGDGQWKQAASMQEGRHEFGCGVMDGKIYVFGGWRRDGVSSESEVYDPNEDTWSPIMPMTSGRCCHQVATAGDQLFVYRGGVGDPCCSFPQHTADSMEVYHPMRNDWKVVELGRDGVPDEVLFMAGGKLHSLTLRYIHVYDADKHAWTEMHCHSLELLGPHITCRSLHRCSVLAVDGEILFQLRWGQFLALQSTPHIFRSMGFGRRKEMPWEIINCSLDFRTYPTSFVCPIQL